MAIVNAPDQIVVAGTDTALARLEAQAAGAGRRLNVAAPSHCPLMAPVTDMLVARLRAIPSRAVTATSLLTASLGIPVCRQRGDYPAHDFPAQQHPEMTYSAHRYGLRLGVDRH